MTNDLGPGDEWRIEMQGRHRIWIVRGLLLAFGCVLVLIVSAANTGTGHRFWWFLSGIPMGDKFGHLGLIGTLSLLLNASLRGRRAPGRAAFMMLGSLVLLIVATLEEGSQIFIATRTFDVVDWLANVAGIALGEWCVRLWSRLALRRAVRAEEA